MRTIIRAPIERCFNFALDIDLEIHAGTRYRIQPIAGVTTGRIGLGERVTWRSKQFGVSLTHTSEITELQRPFFFQDTMVRGNFRFFQHDHFFAKINDKCTEMKDDLRFAMRWFALGRLSEKLLVEDRMKGMLIARNETIRLFAEDGLQSAL